MKQLPEEVYSVATVREVDRAAIEDGGIAGYTLMTRAGAAAVLAANERFSATRRWQVVCGAGNNAGDGYVVARLAASEGIAVSLIAMTSPDALKGDAAEAYHDFASSGGTILPWTGAIDPAAGLIVDAMLGSGLEREVSGDFAAAVDAINSAGVPVMALDIPTGLHGDSGAVLGCAVRADLTVTFVGLKPGLFLRDARDYCGEICFAGLDIPPRHYANAVPAYRRIDAARTNALLPRRGRMAHKGDFGHVLVIGGGPGMPGAVLLCGEGALRAGAGRVSVATDASHAAAIVRDRPELMVHGINGVADLEPLLAGADVIAIGPGLGRSAWAGELIARLKADSRPAVWDADRRARPPAPTRAPENHPIPAGVPEGDRRPLLQALGSLRDVVPEPGHLPLGIERRARTP